MGKSRKVTQASRPMIEWVFGGVSAILVCGVIAFLANEAAFGDAGPPDLGVAIERVETVANGTLVVVAVTNDGDEAATQVGVQATLSKPGEEPVQKEIVFDFIAANAVRRGAFVMEDRTIDDKHIEVRIHGFVEP